MFNYARGMTMPRQVFPDRLRGLALLGIVVVNAPFLGISSDGFTATSIAAPADAATAFLVIALAQGKFYLLFSFLFGYSAAFILRDGSPAHRRRFRRRLLALGLFGVLHAVFFFIGDILLTYALLGFGLLALSGRSDRTLRGAAIASASLAVAFQILVVAPALLLEPSAPDSSSSLATLDAALAEGTFLGAAWARLEALPLVLIVLMIFQGAMAFSAFCVGLLAARRHALADPAIGIAAWRRLAVVGLGVGLPLQLVAAALQIQGISDPDGTVRTALGTVLGFATAPVLSAGYIGLLGWSLVRRPHSLQWAQGPGRASLSVYIGESVVLSLVFCGYGLGRFGTWGALPVVLAGATTWLGLSLLARAWLSRFPQGPLEWLVAQWTQRPAREADRRHNPDNHPIG